MGRFCAAMAALFLLMPTGSSAHEGHGHINAGSPLHYLAEPLHALVFVLAVAIIGGLIYRYLKQPKKS
jgi:hypothetical protein